MANGFKDEEYDLLRHRIDELMELSRQSSIPLDEELGSLLKRIDVLHEECYQHLSGWEKVQLSRHPNRPTTLEYITAWCDEWAELHGDRLYGDDPALIGGLARLDNRAITWLGHQKGRGTQDNLLRNFGMPHPEGYRKAHRLVLQAEKFGRPVLTLINTPGAYPGIGAEARGQAWAISSMLSLLSRVRVPVVAVVTGEGGSGGALALGLADYLIMLSNSVFSVASPEACSAILFRDASKVQEVAGHLGLTAQELLSYGIVDEIIEEPVGGVQQHPEKVTADIKQAVTAQFSRLCTIDPDTLVARRRERLYKFSSF
ncbi:MAG: acetyl-CoA carboxylase carboxyltransferase subunit alpha [Methylocystaceae bacterium]